MLQGGVGRAGASGGGRGKGRGRGERKDGISHEARFAVRSGGAAAVAVRTANTFTDLLHHAHFFFSFLAAAAAACESPRDS